MMSKNKMNGSVGLLADAMRKVFQEGIESAIAPVEEAVTGLRDDMKDMRDDMKNMEERLDQKIGTTNQNMQAQFAEQEKRIGQLIQESKPVS